MKKFFLVFFLILLFFPFISAVELNMKDSFQQGETMIAKVSGNFVTQITQDNVFFYKGHVRIPVDWGMAKINDDYYIYALLEGKTQDNYSISIENVQYMKGSQIISDNIIKNFTITNSTADFSLKPGVITTSSDFSLQVQNLQDKQITINAKTPTTNNSERDIFVSSANSHQDSIIVKSGEIKNINFILGSGQSSLQMVELSSGNFTYEIPVYITTSSTESKPLLFRIEPTEIISSIPTNSVTKRTLYIYNTGSSEITNVSLSLSDAIKPFVNLSKNTIDKIAANSNAQIDLSFFSSGEINADGTLKAMENGVIAYSQISLKFLNNYVQPNQTQSYTEKTCAESQGVICNQDEKCDKETIYARDNVCCLGTCQTTSSNPWTGRIIAIVILAVIATALVWFYKKKYKKAKNKVDLLKIAKGKN